MTNEIYHDNLTVHSEKFKISAIEDEYVGPALEDGKVTLKFVTELMEHYKQEKHLHKKYAYKVNKYVDIYISIFTDTLLMYRNKLYRIIPYEYHYCISL